MEKRAQLNSDTRMHKDSGSITSGKMEKAPQGVAKGWHGDPHTRDDVRNLASGVSGRGAVTRMRLVGLVSVVGSLAGLGASGCDSADNEKSPAAQAPAGEPPPRV